MCPWQSFFTTRWGGRSSDGDGARCCSWVTRRDKQLIQACDECVAYCVESRFLKLAEAPPSLGSPAQRSQQWPREIFSSTCRQTDSRPAPAPALSLARALRSWQQLGIPILCTRRALWWCPPSSRTQRKLARQEKKAGRRVVEGPSCDMPSQPTSSQCARTHACFKAS